MKVLFIGDIVGAPGRKILQQKLPQIQDEYDIDFTIANGENATNGFGLNRQSFKELHACGVDMFTMGNHTWDNKDIYNFIDQESRLVRPANYHSSLPGKGWQEIEVNGQRIAVVNLVGRIYMPAHDCPFATMDRVLGEIGSGAWVFVDIHAEATSEKIALGWYLDGRVTAVVGTHTHVQTNDGRVLPRGTGYLTDAGMTGPRDSVLGVDKDIIIQKFRTGFSPRFEPAHGDLQFNGVVFDIDDKGKCRSVETVNFWEPSF